VISAVDPHSIANEVKLSRSRKKDASALLVEGPTDARLLRNYVNERRCDVVPTLGRKNALDALRLLRTSNEPGVLVILDSDFAQISGTQIADPDVVSTDLHDIEAMMLSSPAVVKLLIEYDLRADEFGPDLGLLLAKTVVPLGYLRFISNRDRLWIKFSDIDFRAFVKTGMPPSIDEQRLIAEVLTKNPRCRLNAVAIT